MNVVCMAPERREGLKEEQRLCCAVCRRTEGKKRKEDGALEIAPKEFGATTMFKGDQSEMLCNSREGKRKLRVLCYYVMLPPLPSPLSPSNWPFQPAELVTKGHRRTQREREGGREHGIEIEGGGKRREVVP